MIELVNVSKKYGERYIFHDLNFVFEDSQCYFLKGVSGAGKTTLLNMIYGYEIADSGSIYFGRKNFSIEYMFQEPLLFRNLSIRENLIIKYDALNKERRMDESVFRDALKRVALNAELDSIVNTLSGGEMQRLQLAQYILSDPDILLLDEPVCKLNYELRKKIYSLIHEIFSDKLVIIVTHEEELQQEEGIYLEMRDGKLWKNS